jgi:1,4-dihydroxy-2-naphthoate octaprenyltransferase
MWWLGARPQTLPVAVAPVVVGTAVALEGQPGQVIWWRFVCALVVAVSVQVGTNYANDYSDGVRGTDDPEQRQGPPRLVGNGLASPSSVKKAMLIAFGVTLLAGVPLVILVNWWLAVVGVAAVAAGWFYTGGPRPYGYAGFGELFVFVFFGLVATAGSAFVQTETLTLTALVCGAAMGCWATALLVVNNLRDIPGDTASGKHTLAVRLGDRRTRSLYTALVVASFILVPVLVALGTTPAVALAFVAVVVVRGAVLDVLSGVGGSGLIPVLVSTGRAQLVFSAALAVGLLIG